MAVMYSKLGGCLEETAKFGPLAKTDYPSDLMKSTVVDESLSSTQLQFCSRENQLA